MTALEISQHITFLHAEDLESVKHFYCDLLGLPLARDQGTCLIFQVTETAYLGFCEHIEAIPSGRKVILTLVSDEVDEWYQALEDRGIQNITPPKNNPDYQIYHFFLQDPNGYWVEIQKFENPL